MSVIQTERLTLRLITLSDAPFLLRLLNSPGWLQYIGDRDVKTVADARAYIAERMLPVADGEVLGNFCCIRQKTGEVLGTCGIYQRATLEHPDLGYAFLSEFWGHGFAREAAQAILANYCAKRPGQPITAFTTVDNTRSINLLEKIGFRRNGFFLLDGDDEELVLFTYNTN
ncbi:MAG: GNAT family N-acetyltransferase [Bacteroidota bacterium]